MKRLVLIDGSSYLYRAYHALPPLRNAEGEPTGALFGVVNMLRAHVQERPDRIAFVVDAPGKTFREALYPAYKANRPPMPDDLRVQVEPMLAMVQALGLPILRVPGVEADDVIGTLAVEAAEAGMQAIISSGDKDFAQLVGPRIALVDTMSGGRIGDDAAVLAKFGVPAARIVDLLALMGDSVDNVPGVDKVGPKTAAKWLSQYGSLEAVIAHAGQIKGKVGENLRAALDRLPLNRQLLTIRTDLALEVGIDALTLRAPDREVLRALYRRHGFNQALRELDDEVAVGGGVAPATDRPGPDPALAAPGRYETILELAQLRRWIARLRRAGTFALDCETDSLDPMRARLVGISFAARPGEAAYLPLAHAYPGAPKQLDPAVALQALAPLLADPEVRKLGQHGKYDLHVLGRHGVPVAGYGDDTLLEAFVLDSGGRLDMDSLARRYLGQATIKYEDVAGKGAKAITFDQVAIDAAAAYAAEDADVTLRLHTVLAPRLAAEPKLEQVYRRIEMPLVSVLRRIEANGVLVDRQALRAQSAALSTRMLALRRQATELAGRSFNLDSPKQLQGVLYDELKLPVALKTPSGQPSTNEEALEAIADRHPLPRVILDYRGLAKLRSTYTEKLADMADPATGRVHTHYHQAGTATGRLASSDPNLQNIPVRSEDGRRIRRAFIAPPGRRLVACDYSQIELRIMAHLSEDPALSQAFVAGVDVHRATAAEVFGKPIDAVDADQRRAAKAINFGLIYGMSAFGLARQLGIPRGQAQDYIGMYFSRYPGVRDYMERTRRQAREKGYVETVFGRRLYLEYIGKGSQAQRAGAERAAINAPMQGTAADIIKRAMAEIDAWLSSCRERALMILQVHDELVFEVDEDFVDTLVGQVVPRMTQAAQLRIPLVVDTGIGRNWDESH